MAESTSTLTNKDVAHIARLSRLHVDDVHLESYRTQLASVLGHIARLTAVDVSAVEPMAHPFPDANRLADDEPGPTLTLAQVLANAPAHEGDCIAVPKVLGGESA